MIGIVKIGGAPGNNVEPLARELAARTAAGERWVLVHGASGVMDKLCGERGIMVRKITSPSGYSSRFVGEEERKLFREAAMAYGTSIVQTLAGFGAQATWIDPETECDIYAKRKDVLRACENGRTRIIRGNYSGTVTKIDAAAISAIISKGVLPVLPPLARDEALGISLNVDGDRLAAYAAGALRADALVILSNVRGLMKKIDDPASLIKNGRLSEWETIEYFAEGNMKRKLTACKEALAAGVPKVYMADGRVENPIENALRGNSTCLVR